MPRLPFSVYTTKFPCALKLNATAAVKSMSLPHDSNVAVMSNDGIVHKLKRVGG